MEIIIGRDSSTSKLKVTTGQQNHLIGENGTVPMDVSRQHCQLIVQEETNIIIKNIKAANVTYVNGTEVQSKKISVDDKVELGISRYLLPLSEILKLSMKKQVDIESLEKIWEDYEHKKLEYNIAERKFNVARSAAGIFSMAAFACSLILGHGPVYLTIFGIAFVVSVISFIVAYKRSSEIPLKTKQLTKDFQQKYVCPNPDCRHFMGFTDYMILSQNKKCPYCGTEYKK